MQTTATGIVTDSDNVAWVRCGWSAVLVGYVGTTPVSRTDGSSFPTSANGAADGTGKITAILQANDDIVPSNTAWLFTVTPLASSKAFTFVVTLTGAAQDITALLEKYAVAPRFELNGTNYGYADVEVSPAPAAGSVGISYLNMTTQSIRFWDGEEFADVAVDIPDNLDVAENITVGGDADVKGTITVGSDAEVKGVITVDSGVLASGALFTVDALNTPFILPGTDITHPTGIWCGRDQNQGGSAVFILDPNTGPVVLTNTFEGLNTPVAVADGFESVLVAGPVPRIMEFLMLAY
jgi:hypothetical protein